MLTWFYCLDMIDAVLLVAVASMAFLTLKALWGEHPRWRPVVGSLAVVWFLIVGYVTLASREPEGQLGVRWIPFYSYYLAFTGINEEMLRSSFMNVVLFYPAGLLAGAAWCFGVKTGKRILLLAAVGCGVSVLVEAMQYFYQLGLVEVDDVIHNTLGMVLGVMVGRAKTDWIKKLRNSDL